MTGPATTVGSRLGGSARLEFALLLACFFLSGGSALVFEVVWTKQLGFVFGTAELAVAAVLASFLGGLGAGAAVAGRMASRVRRPALVYAGLELGVAAGGLAVSHGLRAAGALYVRLFADGSGAAGEPARVAYHLAASFLVVGLPAACMGATLPMLARHAVRLTEETGLRVGLLYAVNTLGGVAGAAVAGFALVPSLGLGGTSRVAVAMSALAAAGASLLALRSGAVPVLPGASDPRARSGAGRGGLVVASIAFASGAVALTYEIFWTRILSHVLGSSLTAFATMLAAFLLGLAGGAALAAAASRDRARSQAGLAVAQLGAAGLSLASLAVVETWAGALGASRGPGALGLQAALAAAALVPSALCLGASFPFAVRLAAAGPAEAGAVAGRLYAWNTAGTIVGSVATALWVLPALGFAGTLRAAAGVSLLAALAAALAVPRRRAWLAGLAAAALAGLAVLPLDEPWRVLETTALGSGPSPRTSPRFFAVGRSATVLVREVEGEWSLTTNGLPEGSIQPPGLPPARYLITRWMGALPGLLRASPASVLVVGLGSGTLLEEVPPSVADLVVVEIEPEVVRANQSVAPERRRDPLTEARTRVVEGDARNALLLDGRRYDAILSQPSHPWASGAAPLYTREFFHLVASRLAPDGIFVQWMGLPFVDEDLLGGLLAALLANFDHLHAFRPPAGAGLLFVASQAPLDPTRWPGPGLPAEWSVRLGLARPEDLAATWVLDTEGARRLAAAARPITDDRNRLETRAPTLRGSGLQGDLADGILAPFDPLVAAPPEHLDAGYLARRLLTVGPPARAHRFAEALPGRDERQLATGLLDLATGESERGTRLLLDLLARRPDDPEARAGLLRAGVDPARLEPLSGLEAAVVEGRRREGEGRPASVRELEPELAAASPGQPLLPVAARLRATWRLAAGGEDLARDAVDLLDLALAYEPSTPLLVLRVRASLAAGDARGALASLSDLAHAVERQPLAPAQRQALLALIEAIPRSAVSPAWLDDVRGRLRRAG